MICVNTNYKLSIMLILVIGCASNTMFLPKGVTLDKNQMIYRDNPMGIGTHDWQGKYHHYAPDMSKSLMTNKSSSFDLLQPTINESSMPTQMLSPTHESIQAEKQGDTKK